ncbi:MAG: hypothetical protein AAGA23_03355 [Pseudomonadota bacterium]
MNSNDLHELIKSKLEQEAGSNTYLKMCRTRLNTQAAQEAFDFTVRYLHNSVHLLDQVFETVKTANCLPMYEPIFDACFHYWDTEYDFIPDHRGIAGICDDAYLSMVLMQHVANAKGPANDGALMPGINRTLRRQNEMMAALLGREMARQLNEVAAQTFQSIHLRQTMDDIFNAAVGGALFQGGALEVMGKALEQNRIGEQVNAQVGGEGIF